MSILNYRSARSATPARFVIKLTNRNLSFFCSILKFKPRTYCSSPRCLQPSVKMGFSVSEYLVTDDLTILLGLIAATIFLLHNLYKPQPLVHPILLGRQSDVARVRNPGESAAYRNYGTGLMGRVCGRCYCFTCVLDTESKRFLFI